MADAQEQVEIVEVNTKEGETFKGELVRIDQDSVILISARLGRLGFSKEEVSYEIVPGSRKSTTDTQDDSRRVIRGAEENASIEEGVVYAFDNQYHLSQSAFPIKRNYYKNTYVFVNTVGVGLNDYVGISFSLEPVSSIAAGSLTALVNLKASLPVTDKFYLGGGIGLATANAEIVALPHFLLSYGTERKHISANVYAVATDPDDVEGISLGTSLAGTLPISQTVNATGEILITDVGDVTGLFGIRKYFTASRIAVDFSLVVFDELNYALPYLSLIAPL